MMWLLDDALTFVLPAVEEELSARGWHCGLTGGVLHEGESDHDLDLIVYPRSTAEYDVEQMRDGLRAAGLEQTYTVEQLHAIWRRKGSDDQKHVEVWETKRGRRIDVFVWPGGQP